MIEDLSKHHLPIDSPFASPTATREWNRYRLSAEQIAFYEANGCFTDDQVEALGAGLDQFTDPANPGNKFFCEYHANESTDPAKTLFHALGAWPRSRQINMSVLLSEER
ncbi:MAG: Phytanoyl-CoA dioxygenase [Acidobacteria bacterium]|nr:Phytanoyl-CoA dioxygenase [Acidobacteriota bacterium]